MKQLNNTLLFLLGISLFLPSCMDEDYNWDNINKEVVIPIGNIPLGDIKEITVDELLPQSLKEQIRIGEDGLLFLEYSGNFDIETPTLEVPPTPVVQIGTVTFPIPGGSLSLPSGESLTIKSGGEEPYRIAEPYFEDANWNVTLSAIKFAHCDFLVDIDLKGITFQDKGATKGQLQVELQFPSNIRVKGDPDNTVREVVYLNDITSGKYTFPAIELESFTYTEEVNLRYTATIVAGSETTLLAEGGSFSFDMAFRTNGIEPDVVYGEVNLNQVVEGTITDIHDLDDAFGEDDLLVFADASLYLNVATNLGANFALFVDELIARNGNKIAPMYNVTGTDGFLFTKPEEGTIQTSSFVLANNDPQIPGVSFKPFDMAPLFKILPTDLDYTVRISNQNISDKTAFYPNDFRISADYRIEMPFSFSELNMQLSETLTDVFSDDLNEYLFFTAGELIVAADEVNLNLGGANEDALEILCSVSILDEYENPIDVDITPIRLTNGKQPLNISINIKERDLDALQNARHLSFDFTLRNQEGKSVYLRNTDSISISGLKIKSTEGIKFEID